MEHKASQGVEARVGDLKHDSFFFFFFTYEKYLNLENVKNY